MKDYNIDHKQNKKNQTSDLKLSGQLNITNVQQVVKELNKTLANKKVNLTIDDVDDIDVAFIQAIIAFKQKCKSKKIELNLVSVLNDDLTVLLQRAGLNNIF